MEKCTNIINDLIENFKINRTTNAATWLTLILSLVAIWFVNKNQSNWKIWLLIAALVVNFIISATFLAQDEDERRNSKLMTGTQVYAICILVAFVGLYASNKQTRTLFIENPAVPAVLLTYLVLLIVSLSQQKNLTTAPGAPKASKAPATSAAPPSSEEIPVDGSSKHKTIQEFSVANIITIIFITSSLLGGKGIENLWDEKGEKVDNFLYKVVLLLLIFAFTLTAYTFSIQAFIANEDDDKNDYKLQEKASQLSVGLYSFFVAIIIIFALGFMAMAFSAGIDDGIIYASLLSLLVCIISMIPIGILSIPIHFNQKALDYIEENK